MPVAIVSDYPEDEEEATRCTHHAHHPRHQMHHPGERLTVEAQRERDGRCASCGLQTHEMRVDPATHVIFKSPLTIEREVHRGRCLLCYPIFRHQQPQQQQQQQQQKQHQHHCSSSSSLSSSSHHSTSSSSTHSRRVSTAGHSSSSSSTSPPTPSSRRLVREALAITSSTANSFDIVDVLSAMSRVPHNAAVQLAGCERLWIFSWEEENSAAIGRVGGIAIILAAMARFPMNAALQQCSTESLQNLALNNDYNCREICDLHGVHHIVQAMMLHPTVAGIQLCGCTALASLATTTNTLCKFHTAALIDQAGGLAAIVTAAQHFVHNANVTEAAQYALRCLGTDGRITPSPRDDDDDDDDDAVMQQEEEEEDL